MSNPRGYNPLRWDCERSGCYNQTLRPRIEEFAGCFPGQISMSDVDGVVEIGGRFLFLEWKAPGGRVSVGQQIMFKQLTGLSPDPMKVTVVVVCGHPREMKIETVQVFSRGSAGPVESIGFDALKERVAAWANRAQRARTRPSKRTAA